MIQQFQTKLTVSQKLSARWMTIWCGV